MIDPKFNELPAETSTTNKQAVSGAEPATEHPPAARRGLSINDTIAGDALLSSGARGVDTSGVRSGAGAGAGSTSLSTAPSSSPAPSIVSGPRTSGTAMGSSTSGQGPTGLTETGVPGTGQTDLSASGEESENGQLEAGSDAYEPTADEISQHAYHCWRERGCPEGSPDVDWERAQSELRAPRRRAATTSA